MQNRAKSANKSRQLQNQIQSSNFKAHQYTQESLQNQKSASTSPEIAKKTKIILDTIDKAYSQLRKDTQVGSLNFINRISLNLEQDKVVRMLHNLSNGYMVTKHSKGTKEPHIKYLYISQDRRFLCWKSLDKNDEKMIQLRKIQYIADQQYQIKQWQESSTMRNMNNNCFIVISQSRNLEIQCNNHLEVQKIVEEIEEASKNSRRMNMSYRF